MIPRLIVLFTAVAALRSSMAAGTVEWQEDVRLHDGRVVVVNQRRTCAAGNYSATRGATCVARDAWLSFRLPETDGVEVIWHERLNPMVLGVVRGKVYVVGFPEYPEQFREYGAKNPPYYGFVLNAGLWKRIPFTEIPEVIYDSNLLIESIPKSRTRHLSLSAKEGVSENGDARYPRYLRRIDPTFKKSLL